MKTTEQKELPGETENYPWLFFGSGTHRNCLSYMSIFLNRKIIPTQCRYFCWKVVISTDSLSELFNLKELLSKRRELSKCGIDRREYTKDQYVGFIYCDNLDEARKINNRFEQSRISRGCTEMRLLMDPDEWGGAPLVEIDIKKGFSVFQSFNMRKQVINNWLKWEGEKNEI